MSAGIEDLESQDTADIGAEMMNWISEIEKARAASKNLKGNITGKMKTRLRRKHLRY